MDDTEKLPGLDSRVGALEIWREHADPRLTRLEDAMAVVRADIAEIKSKFPFLATRADVAELGERLAGKIDGSVNGLLRDALAAVPGTRAVWWAAAGVAAMAASAIISLVALLYH